MRIVQIVRGCLVNVLFMSCGYCDNLLSSCESLALRFQTPSRWAMIMSCVMIFFRALHGKHCRFGPCSMFHIWCHMVGIPWCPCCCSICSDSQCWQDFKNLVFFVSLVLTVLEILTSIETRKVLSLGLLFLNMQIIMKTCAGS